MKEITLEKKYQIACELASDLANALVEVNEFSTPEAVDSSIKMMLMYNDKQVACMMSQQSSQEAH